jgi:DUF971 family protein
MIRASIARKAGGELEPILEVDPEEGVRIRWPDGHQSSYPFGALRTLCPCAMCRQGHGGSVRPELQGPSSQRNRLLRAEPVGRYAVGFVWGDGHGSGIYTWEYLRSNCGCIACRLAREAEGS